MTRPGVSVVSQSQPSPRGIVTSIGTWFVVGAATKGPVAAAQLVRNMTEFATYFGARLASSLLWDSLETFFREGGQRAYVARVVGSSAAIAAHTFADASAGNSLAIAAKNPGVWGNNVSVAITVSSGTFQIAVTDSVLGLIEVSPVLPDQASAVQWSLSSNWINVTIPNGGSTLIPAAVAATALTGGVDDNASITDASRQAALAFFTGSLGPGQVSIPGNVTAGNRTALIAHARANNRTALLDATNTATTASLVTEGTGLQGDEYGALFAPWVIVPGLVAGTTRTVPPTALVAGLIARSDGTNSPNIPAAGDNGKARWALDLTASFIDADRDSLDTAGVNLFRNFGGSPTLYDYITLAKTSVDASWINLGNQRLRMKIVDQLKTTGHTFMFDEIDGRGLKIAEFNAALSGVLLPYFNDNSLYGATPADAYSVDTGSSVNTPDTIAAGQLNAAINVRMSPFAKQVQLALIKVPVNQSL